MKAYSFMKYRQKGFIRLIIESGKSRFVLFVVMILAGCTESKTNAQTQAAFQQRVGGPCEGCEAIYENKTPFSKLDWQLTLPGYNETGPKLHVSGVVYKADGKTPASGTILYFYHTDQKGIYPEGNEKGWGKRHGYIRGWLKTNDNGQYSIKTLKPGAYPNRGAAAHIHCIVKEDVPNEYYIGDFLFEDDPLLSENEKTNQTVPGGNGVLKLQEKNGILYAERNIYLGKNVRNYIR
jgi:protocatechuate 3,4-dioxygenase beta subunit